MKVGAKKNDPALEFTFHNFDPSLTLHRKAFRDAVDACYADGDHHLYKEENGRLYLDHKKCYEIRDIAKPSILHIKPEYIPLFRRFSIIIQQELQAEKTRFKLLYEMLKDYTKADVTAKRYKESGTLIAKLEKQVVAGSCHVDDTDLPATVYTDHIGPFIVKAKPEKPLFGAAFRGFGSSSQKNAGGSKPFFGAGFGDFGKASEGQSQGFSFGTNSSRQKQTDNNGPSFTFNFNS